MTPIQELRFELSTHRNIPFTSMEFRHINNVWRRIESLLITGELKELTDTGVKKRVFITTDLLKDKDFTGHAKILGTSKSSINARKRKQKLACLITGKQIAENVVDEWKLVYPDMFVIPKFKIIGVTKNDKWI